MFSSVFMQGWQVVSWTLDIEPGVHYEVDVDARGSARALYVTRDGRAPLSAPMSVSQALLVCARHAERNEVQALVPGGWRPTSWMLVLEREPARHARYVIDVDPQGAARAVYASHDEHVSLGILPDLGHAMLACAKSESARMLPALREAV